MVTARRRSRSPGDDRSGRAGLSSSAAGAVRNSLLRWYERHRRDLPWRRTRDPYAIWVSEVMLQQTQVATVIPYYHRFVERFPDPASLARAAEDDVLSLWSGLGYYGRARALQRGAQLVVEQHGGRVPADADALRKLPGVGRYTAGAIASIGFGLREPVLDGNVRRVLSRLLAHGRTGGADRPLWDVATTLADGPRPGETNQALMELGALVCTPRAPRCPLCPLARRCRARRQGKPEAFPAPKPRKPVERVRVAVALVRRGDAVLLERPSDGNPLRGTWDAPAIELDDADDAASGLADALARRHALTVRIDRQFGAARHGILQRRLTLEVHGGRLRRGRVAGCASLRWVALRELAAVPISGATRKVLRLLPD